MAQILTVFGATGQQGGSVINFVLQDPELSKRYKVRAITRDVKSPKAQELEGRGVEVVKLELDQGGRPRRDSLESILEGVHSVFAMAVPNFAPDDADFEFDVGKAIADAAVAANVQHLVFSTLPSVSNQSGGKYTNAIHFDAKAKAEEYIRGLPIKSTFFCPAVFMQDFHILRDIFGPTRDAQSNWSIASHLDPSAQLPLIDAVADTGKFVGALLAEPDKYHGKRFCAATRLYTMEEIVTIISQALDKPVLYKRLTREEHHKSFPFANDIFIDVFAGAGDYGYFGPASAESVAWAAANARGKLTTFEEYLVVNPIPTT